MAKRKNRKEADAETLQPLVDEALEMIRTDVGYAISISRSAFSIEKKRQVWKERTSNNEDGG